MRTLKRHGAKPPYGAAFAYKDDIRRIKMINAHATKEQKAKEGYYDEFVDKFKHKLTPDDCYTPGLVYDSILSWARKEYNISEDTRIIRPFWPGKDYKQADYTGDCIVVDNPPFSILSQICSYYQTCGIRFFLFAPSQVLFSTAKGQLNYVITDQRIVYENGAAIPTSFVTNMGEYKIQISPELDQAIKDAMEATKRAHKTIKNMPKLNLPPNVCTAARMRAIAKQHIPLKISTADVKYIRKIDERKQALFGGGFLLSNKAAAEKAAAEIYDLSSRELEIIAELDKQSAT